MSQKAVEQFIGRLITDDRFRERASFELDVVCVEEGYDLTDAERRIIASLDMKKLALAAEFWLDDRIKRLARYVKDPLRPISYPEWHVRS